MNLPLMPKATAVWLIENTALTFEQIAEFCNMHILEIKTIADGEVAQNIIGWNPILEGQLTLEEIRRCEQDENARLKLIVRDQYLKGSKKKTPRYIPVARRQDKPDAIAWFLKNCPEMQDSQICKLIGTTKSTISSIRNKEHWNISNIKPRDPVLLGLCTQIELNKAIEHAKLDASIQKDKQNNNV
ncbi:hypothetical protein NOVO_03055 [Rickettsiales bacterium Ac37b]|nr:hypothetical protein NOVO_03055 [Rickettsiales bacterium Ac37b]